MKKVRTFVIVSGITILTWVGFWDHQDWAANIVSFWVWLSLILEILMYSVGREKIIETYLKTPNAHLPQGLDMVFWGLRAGLLVGAGEFLLGALLTATYFIDLAIRGEAEEKAKSTNPASPAEGSAA